MGLLDGTTQQDYYQGSDHGNYQFTSLSDIINQFMAVYVGYTPRVKLQIQNQYYKIMMETTR